VEISRPHVGCHSASQGISGCSCSDGLSSHQQRLHCTLTGATMWKRRRTGREFNMVTCCRSSKSPTPTREACALRLTNLSLSAGLIFIAAGASRTHTSPPSDWFVSCPLISSPLHPSISVVSRLIWIWISIRLSFAQRRSLPTLFSPLFGFPCSYCGKRPI
jgi:hypothetical protein